MIDQMTVLKWHRSVYTLRCPRQARLRGAAGLVMQDGYLLPFSLDLLRQTYIDCQMAVNELERIKARVQANEAAHQRAREAAEDAYRRVYAELRLALRRLERPTMRSIMRRYGITFYYAPGEEALAEAEAPDGASQHAGQDVAVSYATSGREVEVAAEGIHRHGVQAGTVALDTQTHLNGVAVAS